MQIAMPEAFHTASDELPFADDWANTPALAIGDAESHLRDWPAAVRAQGKRLPETFPIGGAMRYRSL